MRRYKAREAVDMRYSYPIVLIAEEEGGYSVIVPDLPGCVTQGDTAEDAFAMAKDAMAGWIEVTLQDQEEVPKPSTLEETARRLSEILDGIVDLTEDLERVILANVQIDIPRAAA